MHHQLGVLTAVCRQGGDGRTFAVIEKSNLAFPREPLIDAGERSGQLHPYVRPVMRYLPLAIMGVRLRVRHQSVGRARGTTLLPVLPELYLTTAFPITRFSASFRTLRA